MKTKGTLSAAVVGCVMGKYHALALARHSEYHLAALCDLNEATAREVADMTGKPPVYKEYEKMLDEVRLDVVVIATPNVLHVPMVLKAVDKGVKGIYCEKPMAVDLAGGRAMLEACRIHRVSLAVGHQRRTTPAYTTMRHLIREGAIGDVYLLRGTCGGDLMTDGTHALDSIIYLTGDEDVKWVLGQVFRGPSEPPEVIAKDRWAFTGFRYGHAVERGAMAVFEFKSGLRGEILIGDVSFPGRNYQDIEAFGTKGRLWIAGDCANPPLAIQDEKGGGWRPVALDEDGYDEFGRVYSLFEKVIHEDVYNPISGENALKSLEIIMAVFESSRLRQRIVLPVAEERFPLEIMIEEGQL